MRKIDPQGVRHMGAIFSCIEPIHLVAQLNNERGIMPVQHRLGA